MEKALLNCFTLRDFDLSGGATIRISGILNSLADDIDIRFINPKKSVDDLKETIQVIALPSLITTIPKRKFQFLIALFPLFIVNFFYKKELSFLKQFFEKHPARYSMFFEYLDVTIGYWLFKNNLIDNYITDVHGIAPLEFELNEQKSIKVSILNFFKKHVSKRLDKKVYSSSTLIIYPSKGVKHYFEKEYLLQHNDSLVINESINTNLITQKVDIALHQQLLEELNLTGKQIILFAGAFKPLGGILDLLKAYSQINKTQLKHTVLLLIGDGVLKKACKEFVLTHQLQHQVHFLGLVPYSKLKTYQKLADIIVCPDKDTLYSQLLPHIKYFDSISSGNIVINGNFKAVQSINPNEQYALEFEASNVESLTSTIEYALANKETLSKKYELASKTAIQTFNYQNNSKELLYFIKDNK